MFVKKRFFLLFLIIIAAGMLFFFASASADCSFGGKTWPETAEYIDLEDTIVEDYDAFAAFLTQMPSLKRVDMWETRIYRKEIDFLAERFPEIRFGWTMVLQGKDHEHIIRTDYTSWSTLHNNTSTHHTSDDFSILKHCWNLLALDVGHNDVDDLSFLLDLPRLRVLILACNNISDISVLSSLKDLEYAELFKNHISDISPVKDLKHLLDLNICFNRVDDLTPLYNLKTLQRLFIYSCRYHNTAPEWETVQALKKALPDTHINSTNYSTMGIWRWISEKKRHPHYEAIVGMFGSDHRYPKHDYVPFEESQPLPAAGAEPVLATPIPPAGAAAETPAPDNAAVSPAPEAEAASTEKPVASSPDTQAAVDLSADPWKDLENQDFSGSNYLLPIDFTPGYPVKEERLSENGYHDSTISVSLKNGVFEEKCAYWAADIIIKDPSQLRTMGASKDGAFSHVGEMNADSLIARTRAVIAFNGDFFTKAERYGRGFIVRQGVLYRRALDKISPNNDHLMDVLLIDDKGDFIVQHCATDESIVEAFRGRKILNSFSFGPILVENGKAIETYDDADIWLNMATDQGKRRMCICQIGPLHYMVIATAGRYYNDQGLTLPEMARLAESLGVQTAYNLDGGDSSILYLNNEKMAFYEFDSQRKLVDVIYFASAEE